MSEKNLAPSALSPELVAFLQEARLVLVTSLDAETQWPSNNLITWVYAKDAETLFLAAEAKGRIMRNIRADGRLLLTFMAGESCYTVEGTGAVATEEVPGVSLKLAIAEVKVQAVRNITFWGGRITTLPAYDVSYDKSLKEKLDGGVFAAMRAL